MANFYPEHKAVLDDLLLGHPLVRPGKMFGFPAYYVGRKLCICLYEQGVGVKLPEQSAARLLRTDPNAIPFQPMGRFKMREWVTAEPVAAPRTTGNTNLCSRKRSSTYWRYRNRSQAKCNRMPLQSPNTWQLPAERRTMVEAVRQTILSTSRRATRR